MFALQRRSRPRRPSRFVPGVDDLGTRIAPVVIIPFDSGLDIQHPESIEQPQLDSDLHMQQRMAEMISRVEQICITDPTDI